MKFSIILFHFKENLLRISFSTVYSVHHVKETVQPQIVTMNINEKNS
jgi:hypothetical protein